MATDQQPTDREGDCRDTHCKRCNRCHPAPRTEAARPQHRQWILAPDAGQRARLPPSSSRYRADGPWGSCGGRRRRVRQSRIQPPELSAPTSGINGSKLDAEMERGIGDRRIPRLGSSGAAPFSVSPPAKTGRRNQLPNASVITVRSQKRRPGGATRFATQLEILRSGAARPDRLRAPFAN